MADAFASFSVFEWTPTVPIETRRRAGCEMIGGDDD